jgi:hypothetical protein
MPTPKEIFYDDAMVEIYTRPLPKGAARARIVRKIKKALDEAFSAFELEAKKYLPTGCYLDVARSHGSHVLERRISRGRVDAIR